MSTLASSKVAQLVEALHESPVKLSMSICGAGVGALSALTQVAGCSRTLLTGDVLYNPLATAAALDYAPRQFVSLGTARHLAQHAFHTSRRLSAAVPGSTESSLLLGVGATSAVQTSRQRRGAEQAYVSVWGRVPNVEERPWETTSVLDAHLLLPSDMSREQQDEQVALLILHSIGQFTDKFAGLPRVTRHSELSLQSCLGAAPEVNVFVFPPHADGGVASAAAGVPNEAACAIQSVLDGASPLAVFNRYGEARARAEPLLFPESESAAAASVAAAVQPIRLLYSGSFRPLHWGHTELARAALEVCREHFHHRRDTGAADAQLDRVTYEIAAKIVDKGAVSAADLASRVRQFTERGVRVAVTGATLFVEKAALFPGHGFIVGVDTAKRILDPKYYEEGGEAGMVAALRRDIGDRGCYFVVGGRAVAQGSDTAWEDMSTLQVPAALQDLFLSVPEERFRVDISSTELRARQKHATR